MIFSPSRHITRFVRTPTKPRPVARHAPVSLTEFAYDYSTGQADLMLALTYTQNDQYETQ